MSPLSVISKYVTIQYVLVFGISANVALDIMVRHFTFLTKVDTYQILFKHFVLAELILNSLRLSDQNHFSLS